jgi:hypothetical protein
MAVDYASTNQFVYEGKHGLLTNVSGRLESGDYVGSFAQYQPVVYTLPVFGFTAGGEDVRVGKGSSASLPPGSYGRILVRDGATLTLGSGTYFFERLIVRKKAHVDVMLTKNGEGNTLPVHINITGKLDLDRESSIHLASIIGTTRDIRINVKENIFVEDIGIGPSALVEGVLTVPEAKLHFGKNSKLRGAAYAKILDLKPGFSAEYHDDWTGELFREIDMDCDGAPDIIH